MKCKNCGTRLSESSNFCRKCGEPVLKDEELKKLELTDNIDISQIKVETTEQNTEEDLSKTVILPEIVDIINPKKEDEVDFSTGSIESEILKVAQEEKVEEEIVAPEQDEIEIEDEIDKEFVELISEDVIPVKVEDEPTITNEPVVQNNESLENYMNNNEQSDLSKTTSIAYNMQDNNAEQVILEEKVDNNLDVTTLLNNEDVTITKVETPIIKENKKISILVPILIGCIIILSGLLIITNINKDDKKETKEEKVEKEKPVETKKEDKYVMFKGYKIIINDFRNYNLTQDDLILYGDDYTIHTNIELDIKYDTIKSKKESYKSKLKKDGYKVNSYGKKVVDGKEYLVYELTKDKNEYLLAYSTLSNGVTINFVIDSGDEIDYDSLKITNNIISNTNKEMSYNTFDNDFYIR